jgi:hypothetical protein
MARAIIAEWEGQEYEHDPKSADWYWALGIVAIAAAVAAWIFSNYLLALLVVIAAIAIALHAAKRPPLHRFRLVEDGLLIGEDLHPFERMTSFSVLEDVEGDLPPLLSVKTDVWHSAHLEIPLADVDADLVYATLLANVDEEEHRPGAAEVVAAWFGF